jgi:hypothetical protein
MLLGEVWARADRANGTAKTLNVSERRVSVDIVSP